MWANLWPLMISSSLRRPKRPSGLGHRTFPLRITWIPKAVAEIAMGRDPLTDIDEGITQLGLGKNMVEALRCWVEAFQVARRIEQGWILTPIGSLVFDPTDGLDPHFEDVSTSWLLHWLITTNTKAPFFAWECLFNRWPATEFSAWQRGSQRSGGTSFALAARSPRNPHRVSNVDTSVGKGDFRSVRH